MCSASADRLDDVMGVLGLVSGSAGTEVGSTDSDHKSLGRLVLNNNQSKRHAMGALDRLSRTSVSWLPVRRHKFIYLVCLRWQLVSLSVCETRKTDGEEAFQLPAHALELLGLGVARHLHRRLLGHGCVATEVD